MQQPHPVHTDNLEQAHVELHRDLAELESLIGDESTSIGQLRSRLALTRECVKEHFELEERDGYLKVVTSRDPSKEPIVNAMKAEHSVLMKALDQLVQKSERLAEVSETMRKEVQQWLEDLHRHENGENDLVQEVLSTDIGTKD